MKELKGYITDNDQLSIRKQCDLLSISRSTVYYKAAGESEENLRIMRLMDEEFHEHPTHGVIQMQDFLFALMFTVNQKRIRRLLRKMGIMALYPKRNLSKLGQAKYKRPYLLRGLKIDHPNQVWAIDITYLPMAHGFMYLTAIIDVYSRYVVAWDIFNSLDAENSLAVFKMAIARYGEPEIINSDQGSKSWRQALDELNQEMKPQQKFDLLLSVIETAYKIGELAQEHEFIEQAVSIFNTLQDPEWKILLQRLITLVVRVRVKYKNRNGQKIQKHNPGAIKRWSTGYD